MLKSILETHSSTLNFIQLLALKVRDHIIFAEYHGYFILIIIQFYFLHKLFTKYLQHISPKLILIVSFVINMFYLSFLNFFNPFTIPGQLSWVPFIGWIFYFSVAYYCGRNYNEFKNILHKYGKLIVTMAILTGSITLFFYHSGIIHDETSKRIDNVFYTLSMIFVIFYLVTRLNKIPKIIQYVNDYSFSIYLLHPLFLAVLAKILMIFTNINTVIFIVLFMGSLLGSIFTSYIANKFKWGKYLVGKINSNKNKKAYIDDKKGVINGT